MMFFYEHARDGLRGKMESEEVMNTQSVINEYSSTPCTHKDLPSSQPDPIWKLPDGSVGTSDL